MLMTMISGLMFALTNSLGWALVSRSLAGVAAATWVVRNRGNDTNYYLETIKSAGLSVILIYMRQHALCRRIVMSVMDCSIF
jgi:hypothetical protein